MSAIRIATSLCANLIPMVIWARALLVWQAFGLQVSSTLAGQGWAYILVSALAWHSHSTVMDDETPGNGYGFQQVEKIRQCRKKCQKGSPVNSVPSLSFQRAVPLGLSPTKSIKNGRWVVEENTDRWATTFHYWKTGVWSNWKVKLKLIFYRNVAAGWQFCWPERRLWEAKKTLLHDSRKDGLICNSWCWSNVC